VAPNLIHHAVELLIKFTLLKDVPNEQWSAAMMEAKMKYRHGPRKLWREFKRKLAPADLIGFDPLSDREPASVGEAQVRRLPSRHLDRDERRPGAWTTKQLAEKAA
jgi:hypothetical protein